MRYLMALALALSGSLALAAPPSVYKCTGKQGTVVFSQTPCSPNAQQVDTSSALRTGSGGEEALQAISAGVADSNCRKDAERTTLSASQGRIDALAAEKADLERRTRRANNNLAGATYESGLRQQIAGIETSIQQERNSAQAAYRAALAACDERRSR